ncbi:MAG: hypothetical protein K2O89_06075 [Clostridia bacterium]|nr:hypothetical protein [Clostridia bacterium]
MNGVDIAVIVIVCVAVVAVAGYLIYRKVKHKGGCCDCSSGSCNGSCPHCHPKQDDKED